MKIADIVEGGWRAFIHLERYVNRGSPSGFDTVHQVSGPYRPRTGLKYFELPFFAVSPSEVKIFSAVSPGLPRSLVSASGEVKLFVHPDMVEKYFDCKEGGHAVAQPTASSRTVLVDGSSKFFAKLHYDSLIGRVNRSVTSKRAEGAVQVSRELRGLVENGVISSKVAFLPEDFGIVAFSPKQNSEIGMNFRDIKPVPAIEDARRLIPVFSLFAHDPQNPSDRPLLLQMVEKYADPVQAALDILIHPLQEAMVSTILQGGLWPEAHAQNVLIEIDLRGKVKRVVFRDLYEFYADRTIRGRLGLTGRFNKEIDEGSDSAIFYGTRSYLYDFKFGEYVIKPIVNLLAESYRVNGADIISEIARRHQMLTKGYQLFLPADKIAYFPRVEKTYVNNKPNYQWRKGVMYR
jgi:hypothetical protein